MFPGGGGREYTLSFDEDSGNDTAAANTYGHSTSGDGSS